MYGYQISQSLKFISDNEVALTEGALYPALHKLVDEGLLKVEPERFGNRERKYYSLSPAGLKAVDGQIDEARRSVSILAGMFGLTVAPYGVE